MDGDTVWLLIGLGTATLLLFQAWRRLDARPLAATHDRAPPEEPCWTEEISTDGRLSYGRYSCYHADLAEMEARARTAQFNAPY
jgi:hypothetical protein